MVLTQAMVIFISTGTQGSLAGVNCIYVGLADCCRDFGSFAKLFVGVANVKVIRI